MAILRWRDQTDPIGGLDDLRTAVDQVFGNYMARPGRMRLYRGVFPLLNITENEDNLSLTAELPGINPNEIDISATAGSISLRGERKESSASEEVNYHQREREFGTFRRVIDLPTRIDTDKINASYKNGILTVVLPKAEEVKPKQIQIKTS
jgi:HSP20 family protein